MDRPHYLCGMQARYFLSISSLLLALAGGLMFVYEAPQMAWVISLGISCALFCGQMLDTALTWKGSRLALLPTLLAVICVSYWFWIYLGQNEMQILLWSIGSFIFPLAGLALLASLTPAHRTRPRVILLITLTILGAAHMFILLDQAQRWGYLKGFRTDWILLAYFLNLILLDLWGKWRENELRLQQTVLVAGLWYTAFEYIITFVID